ncbi:MAG: hypothetical protein ACE5I8_00340 [Thermodesulfobacteriota bacterium]
MTPNEKRVLGEFGVREKANAVTIGKKVMLSLQYADSICKRLHEMGYLEIVSSGRFPVYMKPWTTDSPDSREVQEVRRRILALYEEVAALRAEENSGGEEQLPRLGEETGMEKGIRETPKRENPGRNYGTMDEIPFIDLTEKVHLERNFERLGEVKRTHADIRPPVNSLRRLKGWLKEWL